MKILTACNAFKESMTSVEAGDAIERGFRAGMGGRLSFDNAAIADGGDGTLDAVESSVKSERVKLSVEDPLGRRRRADYLLIDGGRTAVVEMAAASGIARLESTERNPLKTSSTGTGRLIAHAISKGVKKIYVGIGGSATNDGGTGIASALGYRFLSGLGKPVVPCGGSLENIQKIDINAILPAMRDVEIIVASDVTNPLLGTGGAAAVYAPQKGADQEQVRQLEKGLANLAHVVERDLGSFMRDFPGAGAAGGAGYGLLVFLGAKLKSGIDFMIELTGLEKKVQKADLVITGEGHVDAQSIHGKAPVGVLRMAKKYKKPVLIFCGGADDEKMLVNTGFSAVIPIVDSPMSLEEAIKSGPELIEKAAYRAALVMKTGKGL